jgi:branched-chain amino acid transport system substrate-binding protein
VKQYTQLQGDLADKIIGGSIAIDPSVLTDPDVGPRMIGVVAGVPTNTDSTTPEYQEYVQILQENWGADVEGSNELVVPVGVALFGANWATGAEAIARSLETVGGDLSDGGAAFREALTALGEEGFESVNGPTTLDENRQAIGNNYLVEAVSVEETPSGLRTLKTIENVDQTFGGNFSPDTPTPDRENPACDPAQLQAPPWVGQ